MSNIKISQLPLFNSLDSNTSNVLFIMDDMTIGTTGVVTGTTISQKLYANNALVVGNNPIIFSNTIAQFASSDPEFLQVNLQNFNGNGSADQIITADVGTNSIYYIDMGMAGSTYNYPGYTVYSPLDGYLLVQGNTSPGYVGGNLVIGAATSGKDIVFFQGGTTPANVVGKFAHNNGFTLTQKPLNFADGTTQNTAAAPIAFTQAAFNAANTASSNTVSIGAINNAQNTTIQLAWNSANSAIANTSGVSTAGDFSVTGNLVVLGTTTISSNVIVAANVIPGYSYASLGTSANTWGYSWIKSAWFTSNVFINSSGSNNTGSLTVNNSTFIANTAAINVSAAGSGASVQPPSDGHVIQLTGKDGVPARAIIDSFGTGAYALISGRSGRGTAAAPTATQLGDVIARYSSSSYGTTGFLPLGVGKMEFVATENHSDTNRGTKLNLGVTAIGSNVVSNVVTINTNSVSFGGLNTVANTIVDMANSRIQVSNTGATGNTAFATSYITYTPYYNSGSTPNGRVGDKKGMIFFDTSNIIGNGIRMYYCSGDYDGVSKIWWTQNATQATWS